MKESVAGNQRFKLVLVIPYGTAFRAQVYLDMPLADRHIQETHRRAAIGTNASHLFLPLRLLDHFPEVGDSFQYKNLTVTVTETDDLRADKLRVEVGPEEDEDGENGKE